ncbi:MAG TPA: TadE/TadG family type IV pilus assembly protein [Anaerolineae bacterium]
MPLPLTSAVSALRPRRLFRRDHRGSAAVEFALVAPVFFGLLFAILETGITFFAGQVLQTVAQDAARMILTGQAQTASYTSAQFATYVCSKVPALFTCSNISIDVANFPSFSAVTINNPIDTNRNFVSTNLQYSTGGPGDIVILRLFYQWPQVVTGLGWNPSNLAGNKRLLVGTAAFKNEPY